MLNWKQVCVWEMKCVHINGIASVKVLYDLNGLDLFKWSCVVTEAAAISGALTYALCDDSKDVMMIDETNAALIVGLLARFVL